MNFENNKAIYEQMADRLCDEIIAGTYKSWRQNTVCPGVCCYAAGEYDTAVKAYELLSREEIIYNRRGLGYFVSAGAREQIMSTRRKTFLTQSLPSISERWNC